MRRSAGSTSALLQKATSQLKGERIEKPEDELNAYISSLTQKTAQQKKSVNFEDLGDSISISSDIEEGPPVVTKVTPTASKFLKKKTLQNAESEDGHAGSNVSKFLKKPTASSTSPAPSASIQSRYGGQASKMSTSGENLQRSSALSKASALTGKIQQRAATRRPLTVESDSDESFIQLARSSGEQPTESVTTESVKIGRDGGKFMKKKAQPASITPPQVSKEPQRSKLIKPDKRSEQRSASHQKASPYTLKSSLKYSTNVVLTSDEESMADFMAGLPSSSGDSFEKHRPPKKTAGRRTPSPPPPKRGSSPNQGQARPTTPLGARPPSPKTRPTGIRRTPSPSPRTPRVNSPSTGLRKRSQSPKLYRSYSDDSNVAESIQSEIADEMDFGTTGNIIMDLDELGPVEDLETSPSIKPVRSTARKSQKENKKPRKSALKSTSEVSITEKSQSHSRESSPFKAKGKKSKDSSLKASKKSKDSSPFRSTENSGSIFKANSASPFKAKSESPFKASSKDSASSKGKGSPFKASSNDTAEKTRSSPFRASDNDSPKEKTTSKVSSSSFHAADNESPFKASSKVAKTESKADKKAKRNKTKKEKKAANSKSKKSKSTTPDIFSSFGLQTVDDLFGHSVSIKESEYDSVMSEVDEVRSEISDDEEIQTEKVSVLGGRSSRYDHSVTDVVVTEIGHSTASYTEDFDSVSERIGVRSPSPKRSSMSEVKTRYSGGEETVADYTETFEESDSTETETMSRSISYRSTQDDRTYSDETYDSYTEDYSKSLVPSSRSDVTPAQRAGMRTTEVQTSPDPGLSYQWNPYASGMAFPGMPLGMGFVDPTPIATHVVSADALEAMTAYSPAMLALHDMLRSQLELTREFVQMQRHVYSNCVSNLEDARYHYTTLEDTKNYIKKHKRKRLTFKEALKLVDMEEARRH